MQISHVLKKEYLPERFETLVLFGGWILTMIVRLVTGNPFHYLGFIVCFLAGLDLFRFFLILSLRISKLLQINILFWTPPKQK